MVSQSCETHLFNFLDPLGPQALMYSEVGRSRHFWPIGVFRFLWAWDLKLWCKVPLRWTS